MKYTALNISLLGAALMTSAVSAFAEGGRIAELDFVQAYFSTIDIDVSQADARGAAIATMDGLLGPDATVALRDLGVTQSKDEFIESLDGVFDALEGGRFVHRLEPAAEGSDLTALVCYEFSSNTVLNRETFVVDAGKLTAIVQEQIADNCEAL